MPLTERQSQTTEDVQRQFDERKSEIENDFLDQKIAWSLKQYKLYCVECVKIMETGPVTSEPKNSKRR